jgi:hypothetical protein
LRDEEDDRVFLKRDRRREGVELALPMDESYVLAAEIIEEGRVKLKVESRADVEAWNVSSESLRRRSSSDGLYVAKEKL